MSFAVQWGGEGPYLFRQLVPSSGYLVHGRIAARHLGWDGQGSLTVIDRDGLPIAGFVPTESPPSQSGSGLTAS